MRRPSPSQSPHPPRLRRATFSRLVGEGEHASHDRRRPSRPRRSHAGGRLAGSDPGAALPPAYRGVPGAGAAGLYGAHDRAAGRYASAVALHPRRRRAELHRLRQFPGPVRRTALVRASLVGARQQPRVLPHPHAAAEPDRHRAGGHAVAAEAAGRRLLPDGLLPPHHAVLRHRGLHLEADPQPHLGRHAHAARRGRAEELVPPLARAGILRPDHAGADLGLAICRHSR